MVHADGSLGTANRAQLLMARSSAAASGHSPDTSARIETVMSACALLGVATESATAIIAQNESGRGSARAA